MLAGLAATAFALAAPVRVAQAATPAAPATHSSAAATVAEPATNPAAHRPVRRRNPVQVAPGPYAVYDRQAASGDVVQIRRAIAALEAAAQTAATEADLAWRLAKAYFHLYDELPAGQSERAAAAESSLAWGERAVAASDSAEAKYWYAQSLLALSDVRGALTFLTRIRTVKAMMREVLHQAPAIDDAGPDRFFAILYDRAPWPFADRAAADAHARAAYARAPYRCANVLVAGKAKLAAREYAAAATHVAALEQGICTASSLMWEEIYRDYGKKLRKELEAAGYAANQ